MAAKLSPEEKAKQAAERNAAREAARAAKAAEKKVGKDQPMVAEPVASESSSPQNDLEKHPKFAKFKRGGSPQ